MLKTIHTSNKNSYSYLIFALRFGWSGDQQGQEEICTHIAEHKRLHATWYFIIVVRNSIHEIITVLPALHDGKRDKEANVITNHSYFNNNLYLNLK